MKLPRNNKNNFKNNNFRQNSKSKNNNNAKVASELIKEHKDNSFCNLNEETDSFFDNNRCAFDGARCDICEKLVVSKDCSKASDTTKIMQMTNKNLY